MKSSLAVTGGRKASFTHKSIADTRERPYDCPCCQISFPRADVRDKHIKRFHTTEALNSLATKKGRTVQHERSKHACDRCRKGKLKCNDQRPCKPCQSRGLQCTVSPRKIGPGRPIDPEADALALTDTVIDCNMLNDSSTLPTDMEMTQPEASNSFPTTTASYSSVLNGTETHLLGEPESSITGPSMIPQFQQSISLTEQAQEQSIPSSNLHTSFGPSIGPSFDDIGTTQWTNGDFNVMDGIWELPLLVGFSPLGSCLTNLTDVKGR